MKTKLLLMVCLLLTAFAFSQTTVAIPDDAFEAYLEAEFASNIAPDGSTTDGSITFTDIDLVVTIDFPTAGVTTVTDMTGVNQFPKLKNLYCNDNQITGALDVSNLPDLTNLYCFNNPGLTSINVANCPKIYHVKAYSCGLTTVDFSLATTAATDNTRLRYLYLNDNALTSVDYSGNTALYRIDLFNNNLTSVDISGITTLQYLRIQGNSITGDLDVSANLGLEKLGAYNNNLSSINLGAIPYTAFSYFKISGNSNLTCVFTDNPSDYIIGGALDTAIGSNYSADSTINFVVDQAACDLLATDSFSDISLQLYPNPVAGHLNVSLAQTSNYSIFNTTGNKIIEGTLEEGDNVIQTASLTPGLYFLTAVTLDGNSLTKKFIKE